MLSVLACVTTQHDLRLVALAALICVLSVFTGFTLVGRAAEARAARWRWIWLAAAGTVIGSGVWSTHFVAGLAYRPNLPIGYDILLTALSAVIAIAMAFLGLCVGVMFRARKALVALGGAIVGVAVGAMHFTGMAAMRVPAQVEWDWTLIVASLVLGISGGALALRVALARPTWNTYAAATAVLVLGIVGLHFTAMTAALLIPDPTIALPDQTMSPQWLAVGVAIAAAGIVAFGLAGSLVDHRLAERAARETERLRRLVRELEATRTELQATTANLEQALEAAAASSQAKSQFLAAMSHELRTPLNAIIGFSEMLVGETYGPLGDARYRDYVRTIRHSGTHLLDLINDVLDFSKIEAGKLDLAEDMIDVNAAIDEALRMVENQAASGKVVLGARIDGELPLITADARRVRQVLLNLLSNAVKFTPRGGEVTVSAAADAGGLAIAVADTGIGMAPEDIPKALERFGQIDTRLARRYEGTGLGLPLSLRLMELHGGTLAIDSALGRGTTVTVTFPAGRIVVERAAA
jgi:signal transduction histidine kinase